MPNYIASYDFDGTLRFNDKEAECINLLNSLPANLINVINTGRGIKLLSEKIKSHFPAHYNLFIGSIKYFICNNGTDIYYKVEDSFETLSEWSEYLKPQWNRAVLLDILSPIEKKLDIEMYPETYNFKLLYYFHRKNFAEADKVHIELLSALKDQPVNVVYAESSQPPPPGLKKFVCEIFPKNAGKGNALLFLKEYLISKNTKIDAIACFGDDRNDFQTIVEMPLVYDWWYGCLVGNSSEWIKNEANKVMNSLKGKITIAPTEFVGPDGVLWNLKKLNWIS